ncbi:pyrroloquinoline quinone biosynthesis protein PqqB [Streptomyces sp. ISL-1]|uniref:pyrroloquinoline quinone biosynthesis protein PqqB n=1 Tax=Streptomyces sp. ISL-1 TaxID=2817657 RepID=UPI001BE81E02|nr:pyrroloquinoline quinone biosynthesis protein PqqB [Streptomyces sp. ISL-1]MBT2392219.1 pyrroloquinoline quinone biosynthesis protein PqqB [Streptomyces sp. ISL-1]
MLLQVLGTAAGGGLPQWNCACPGCAGARAHPHRRRRHASLALRADEGRWYLVNATPDIGDQIEDSHALRPGPGPRESPVAGVILTDAELDHTLGIARLREADGFDILATGPVRDALLGRLRLGEVLAPYTRIEWRELGHEAEPLVKSGTVEIDAVPVSAKRPRYATGAGPNERTWVVALRLRETTTGRSLIYAPALARWTDEFQEAVEEADCVILDGTFWDDYEPVRTSISAKTATGMGHLPIVGPNGTARRLSGLDARCLYTHLNNTNPLADPDAPQHALLGEWGLEVAADRMVIEL